MQYGVVMMYLDASRWVLDRREPELTGGLQQQRVLLLP